MECWHHDCNNCSIACDCGLCIASRTNDASAKILTGCYDPWGENNAHAMEDSVSIHYCSDCHANNNDMSLDDFNTPGFAHAAVVLQRRWRSVLAAKKLQTLCEWLDAVEPGYGEKYGDIFGAVGMTLAADMDVFVIDGDPFLESIFEMGVDGGAAAKIKTALRLL